MTSGEGIGRDEQEPKRSLEVAPTLVRGSGGGRVRGVVVLAAVVLLIAGAVGIAQLAGDRQPKIAQLASGTIALESPAVVTSPTPGPAAAILDATPIRLRATDLAAGIRDGSLEGRLVFVDGKLSATPVGCRSLATVRVGCVDLAIPGVGVQVHAAEPSMVWSPAPPLGAWLVTVARAGGLVYLGSLLPDRDVATSVPELERRLADGEGQPSVGTLFQANGTLVTNIPSPCNDLCPPPPPYLADERTWADPALPETGTAVDVARNAPEIRADTERFDGTFLLARTGDGAAWQVVARYVPSHAVRVQVP